MGSNTLQYYPMPACCCPAVPHAPSFRPAHLLRRVQRSPSDNPVAPWNTQPGSPSLELALDLMPSQRPALQPVSEAQMYPAAGPSGKVAERANSGGPTDRATTDHAALNLQRAGESKWRPLELCRRKHRAAAPAKGKEYPALGFKKLQ
ncbi:hypothetical protein QJQ45_026139 [Haematococcus lacustris]|nr:hypothetical protein QJQ45_026139 [Haematococcus lacustris]